MKELQSYSRYNHIDSNEYPQQESIKFLKITNSNGPSGKPRYILDLLLSVIDVSVQTVDLVGQRSVVEV